MLVVTPFAQFIEEVLKAKLAPEISKELIQSGPLVYFERAFTDKTFLSNIIASGSEHPLDYEVLEKIGDKAYNYIFQKWLYSVIGQEIDDPEIYANAEKNFASNNYMDKLAKHLGLEKYIKVGKGIHITEAIRSDVFEAFVAAIILSSDKFIREGTGSYFAEIFLFKLLNETTRDLINPAKGRSLVDYRSQINEIYTFSGWPTPPDYVTESSQNLEAQKAASRLNSILGTNGNRPFIGFKVLLRAPTTDNVPVSIRGKEIGIGEGSSEDAAREAAAKNAIETIQVDFKELNDNARNYRRQLKNHPDLIEEIDKLLATKPIYQSISIRQLRMIGTFMVQIRVQIGGINRNAVRSQSRQRLVNEKGEEIRSNEDKSKARRTLWKMETADETLVKAVRDFLKKGKGTTIESRP